jgi:hypothetical protein
MSAIADPAIRHATIGANTFQAARGASLAGPDRDGCLPPPGLILLFLAPASRRRRAVDIIRWTLRRDKAGAARAIVR